MTRRDILDQIDDVITWDGHSPDAMHWSAAPPPKPFLSMPVFPVDAEAAQQVFARLGEQMQAFAEAFRPVAEQIGRNLAAMTRAFNDIVNTPAMRELVQEQRRARSAMKSEYARRNRRRVGRR